MEYQHQHVSQICGIEINEKQKVALVVGWLEIDEDVVSEGFDVYVLIDPELNALDCLLLKKDMFAHDQKQ